MDMLTVVLITAVVSFGIATVVYYVIKSRQSGQVDIPWNEIRPVLSEMFVEVMQIIKARKEGYLAIEDYAVNFVYDKIQEADFLHEQEKQLLSKEFIRSIIAPRLRELYAKEKARL